MFAWFVVVIVLALWTRALARLGRSLTRRPALPIAVVGLVKPRVVCDPALSQVLDADAFGAALAHEEAHRRHRDPARIVIAQLAVDLQWPWPQARRRLASWREALEEARDDEAICDGAHPDDLAAAIIGAARLLSSSTISRPWTRDGAFLSSSSLSCPPHATANASVASSVTRVIASHREAARSAPRRRRIRSPLR